jgi:hypothetical protein
MPECPRPFTDSGREECRLWESVVDWCAGNSRGEKARNERVSCAHCINQPRLNDALPDDSLAIAEDSAALTLRDANQWSPEGVNFLDKCVGLSVRKIGCG